MVLFFSTEDFEKLGKFLSPKRESKPQLSEFRSSGRIPSYMPQLHDIR